MALDIGRIEAWTREMLEAEARKRGIRGPEFRPRRDLIRLILRHQYGDQLSAGRERIAQGVRAVEQARETIAGVVSTALAALPEPLESLMKLRARLPGARAPQPKPFERRYEPAPERAAAPVEPLKTGRRLPIVETPPFGFEPAAEVKPEAAPAPAESATPVAAAPSPAPSTRTFVEEPIRTHSMARVLAAQGHRERALAIYAELLAQNSEDAELRNEAEALRQGHPIAPPLLPDPPLEIERAALPDGADVLRCDGHPATGMRLRWQISSDGERRARAVLGRDGELAVRVVAIRPDPTLVVRSEITEHGPVAASDSWLCPALPDAARCFVAVGLRNGDHFVAIVHAHPQPAAAVETRPSEHAFAQ
jgi:hypothetical protein